MRIYFSTNSDNTSGQFCPHILKNDNDQIIRVGSDQCKQCKYCIHYEIQHSLMPKNIISSVDDWHLPSVTPGMSQYTYADVGFVKCGHTIYTKRSIKLLLKKMWWRVVRLCQCFS